MGITLNVSPVSKAEGNSGDTTFNYTFTLSGGTPTTSANLKFDFNSANSTADASDFSNFINRYNVDFAPGQTQTTLDIVVKGDTTIEPDETFNYKVGTGSMIRDPNGLPPDIDVFNSSFSGTILNDDFSNQAPTATADTVTTGFNKPVTIPVATLLANDTDPDANNTLSITGVSNPTNGIVSFDDNGTATTADDVILFTPTTGFSGDASFNYTLSDGSLSSTGNVTVAVGKIINGGNSNQTLTGTRGDDLINGGNGRDIVFGDGGNDTLFGGNGDDKLWGGVGNDILTGGNGADTFAFAAGDGRDTITDFKQGTDFIGLTGGLSFGQLSFSGSNILVTSTNEILATLTGVNTTTLTAANFVTV